MFYLLTTYSFLIFTAVFITLVKHDYWIFRSLEYPRFQKFILVLIGIAAWLIFSYFARKMYWFPFGMLLIAAAYLAFKIFPYTVFSKKEVLTIRKRNPDNEIKIISANVLQYNTNYQKLLEQIKSCDPDVIFLLETDQKWADAASTLIKDYPHTLLEPLDNTYGLLFYSRLEMLSGEIKYVVQNDIPSIDAIIKLAGGQKVQIWGLHPEPPVPGESLYSTAKDKELMKTAFKARDCKIPAIAMGDLNDVAWSYTTSLFTKTSRLLDVRKGRGFYSTFSAKHWYIKFPLDYIFCSDHFGLVKMQKLPYNGSDHYPIFTHLIYRSDLAAKQEAPMVDEEELDEAKEMAEQPVV